MNLWKRIMGYLGPYRRWAITALIGVIGTNALAVIVPIVLGDVIDIGIERNDSRFMLGAGLLVVLLGILRGVMGFLGRFFGERLSHHIAFDIRNAVYDKVQTLSFGYHDNAHVGTLVTRAISDVGEIQRYFAFGLFDGLNTGFLLLGVVIVMFSTSPILAVIALLPMIPLSFMSRNFAFDVRPRWKQVMEQTQQLSNRLQENALGAEVVRVFARESFEREQFGAQNERLFNDQLGLIRRWVTFIPTSAFIVSMSVALVLFFGGIMEQRGIGNVTVGTIVSFNFYVLLLSQPMRFLGFVILLTTQAIASAERVFEILDAPVEIESKPNAQTLPNMQGHVHFDDVCFKYERQAVLQHITFEAHPGQVIGLIGATGSGKTSVINLIPRFYDVTEGSVKIDGVDVRDLDVNELRSYIGNVLQTSLLFSATIGENIAYGKPEATQEQIEAAAKAANAHDFIVEFPDGYDTIVGERGVTLSGGQRQRTAIARALLINPRILILDDATSSVDTRTENLIQQALDTLMDGRTTFIIAQRLSSVINVDLILVLADGEIVQRGKHADLITIDGPYKELYELQMAEQDRLRSAEYLTGDAPPKVEDERRITGEFRAIADLLSGGD